MFQIILEFIYSFWLGRMLGIKKHHEHFFAWFIQKKGLRHLEVGPLQSLNLKYLSYYLIIFKHLFSIGGIFDMRV